MLNRKNTRPIFVKDLQIGGQNKVIIQSMTNTKTKDISSTVSQINRLMVAGCELVRMAVLDEEDARAIKEIKKQVNIPLCADIHFNYRLALIAIESGIDKIRLNPGNILEKEHVKEVVKSCIQHKVPIRIGINSGSIEKEILEKYGKPTSQGMIESAQKHIDILEELGFYDIVLSFKTSSVPLTIDTYKLASETFKYPLHLGVTEAGTFNLSAIKSSAALGALLHDGIGDTLRISVSDAPETEIKIARHLLNSFDLTDKVANLISCPTCGRIQYDMLPIAKEIEEFLESVPLKIDVAVMGCPVNGPQEASRADVGIAGGKEEGLLFRKGTLIKRVKQENIVEELKNEIYKIMKERT